MLPHDKYQKLSAGQPSVPHIGNQLQNYKVTVPPPGLPATDIRAQRGAEVDRKKVELKRDKQLEQEMREISDTESENSESASEQEADWISVWKELK